LNSGTVIDVKIRELITNVKVSYYKHIARQHSCHNFFLTETGECSTL